MEDGQRFVHAGKRQGQKMKPGMEIFEQLPFEILGEHEALPQDAINLRLGHMSMRVEFDHGIDEPLPPDLSQLRFKSLELLPEKERQRGVPIQQGSIEIEKHAADHINF